MKILYLILTLCCTGFSEPCIPIDPSYNYNTYEEFTFQTLTSICIYVPRCISTSGNLYLYGKATDSSTKFAYLRKQDMDENIFWDIFVPVTELTYYGFDVAPNEELAYFIPAQSPMQLFILNATTGMYVSGRKMDAFDADQSYSNLYVSPDSSTVFFTASKPPRVSCKYRYTSDSLHCFYNVNYGYVHSFLPVNSNTIFATIEADSKDKSEIRKIELNDTTTTNIWISRATCKTICDSHQDKAVLSSSADKLYVFLNIDYVKLFVSLNTTDGSVVGDRFVSSNTANCNYQFIDCMVLFGGKIYISYYCIQRGLIVFDISSNSFTESYEYTSPNLNMSKFVIYNSILYYFGCNTGTNNAVISKAALTGLSAIPNITLASLTMNKITNSDYSFVIFGISDSMVTSSITSFAFTASTKVFDRISYINQDIVPHTSAESFLFLRENDSNVIQAISQTCSKSGNTNFEIAIVQNGVDIIPAWVSDDPSTMQLKLNTPSVNLDTNYSFKIKTKYGNLYSDEKIINLKVLNCLVLNCDLCQNDPALCQICTSGYKVSTDSKSCKFVEQPSKTETNSQQNSTNTNDSIAVAGTVTQVVVGANVILGSTTSILCGTSTQGAWASINQFQLYLLVPLLNIYIHPDILDFLSGFTFSFFSFSFFRVEEFEFIKFILSVFSDKKSNNYLESIGIRYVNSFRNHAKIIFTLTIFIILHLMIVFPFYRLIKCIKSESFLTKIIEYILNLFMLTLYIRSLLEAFLFCFLSIIIEMQSIGFTYSIILFLFWIAFIGAFYTIWMRYCFGSLDKDISYFREFFSGIKESKICCFYFNFFILRRILCVLIVILLQDCSKYVQVVLFSLVNLICLGFSCGFRPFFFIKDNLIDIINDLSFAVFCTQMIYLNSESVWNKVSVNFNIYFCLSCCLLTSLINFIFICYELIKFIRSRIQRRKITNMHESDANNSALSHTTQNQHDEITLHRLEENKNSNPSEVISKIENLCKEWNANRFAREEEVNVRIQKRRYFINNDI